MKFILLGKRKSEALQIKRSNNKQLSHVVFIVENSTPPIDIRVWREAKTIKEAGYRVSVIAPKTASFPDSYEMLEGIEIYRHQSISRDGKMGQLVEYVNAFIQELILGVRIFLKDPFILIHGANPPDHIFLLSLLFRPFGVKFIFDHHDLASELYLCKYRNKKNVLYYLLSLMEKLSCKLSDVIISTNESYRQHVVQKHHVKAEKIFIVRNDPEIPSSNGCHEKKLVPKDPSTINLLYLGAINFQDGVDQLVKIISILVNEFNQKSIKCTVIGSGGDLLRVKLISKELGMDPYIDFLGVIRDRALIVDHIRNSDICLEPAPFNGANNQSTFIKVMEYMREGKPIVAFDLVETRFSTGGNAVLVRPTDLTEFADAVDKLIREPHRREALGQQAQKRIYESLNWNNAANNLRNAYKSVFS